MFKKIVFSIIFLYLFIVFQMSFLVHFFPFLPNLILLLVVLVNLIDERKDSFGFFFSLAAGFLLDVFSENWFGFFLILSITISLLIKFVVKKYIYQKPSFISLRG